MPVVTFSADDLCRVIGKSFPAAKLAERMPMMGGDLDRVEGDRITIEWFPNRTDLLTVEGTGRALRAFLDVRPGLATYDVGKPRTELKVDASVAAVRPYAALCFVRGVPFDDAYVATVIEAQEKLTHSPGRRRKKIAIGIHDAAHLQGPFTYVAVGPKDNAFVPLAETRSMTPAQILTDHPKGREFGHLLPAGRFPVFLDGGGEVLSLPPVINAQKTAVTAKTRDLLLDVTGTDAASVRQAIALLSTSFAERGGTIEAVTVHDASGTWTCPDLKPTERVLHVDEVKAILGLEWSADEVATCLRRMGHDADPYGNKVLVRSPPWRFDLLHPVDLIEDVGIGHGFDLFPGDLPNVATFGGALPLQALEDSLRAILVGHGWSEARTLSLSDAKSQATNWGDKPSAAVTLLNPVMEEQTALRTRLAPSLLNVLATNRHRSLPQRLFEVGYVVAEEGGRWRNRLTLAGVEVAAKTGFSDAKGLVEAIVRDAALECTLDPGKRSGLVAGRQGTIRRGGKDIGWFGELHPDTVVAFGLTAPAIAFEVDLSSFA